MSEMKTEHAMESKVKKQRKQVSRNFLEMNYFINELNIKDARIS